MMKVREKSAADEEHVLKIVALATEDLRRVYCPTVVAQSDGMNGDHILPSLVAVEGEVVVGAVEYRLEDDSLYIQGLAVHPLHRRRGIARELIQAAEGVAVREGKSSLILSTIKETGNPAIFARLGFSVIDEAPARKFEGLNGQPVTKVDMCRRLA